MNNQAAAVEGFSLCQRSDWYSHSPRLARAVAVYFFDLAKKDLMPEWEYAFAGTADRSVERIVRQPFKKRRERLSNFKVFMTEHQPGGFAEVKAIYEIIVPRGYGFVFPVVVNKSQIGTMAESIVAYICVVLFYVPDDGKICDNLSHANNSSTIIDLNQC